MTENNQTNPPSLPTDSDNGGAPPPEPQHVPGTPRKTRHGRFASDGHAPRREVPVQPQRHSNIPINIPLPAAGSPATPVSPVISPKRFEAESRKSVPPKQPQQVVKQPAKPSAPAGPVRLPIDVPFERTRLLVLALIMVPLCIWGSLPAWGSMVHEWYYTDDYNHGFIVIPATLLFLYLRLETYPGTRYKLDWVGLFPIFIYGVLRYVAAEQYISPLDAVAIWFWILSVVWFFYGWRVFLWALPSLCFLVFMFQLPFTIDMFMRNQLQLFAAQFAAVLLQMIGVAAVPITNTIRLSTTELGVEAACSGLRFLMSVFAIAFATVLLMRRPWWQNILILAIAAPLALFVNALRITITGVLLEYHHEMVAHWTREGQSVGVVADGFAGMITIVLALGLFALFVWYLGKVFRQVEI